MPPVGSPGTLGAMALGGDQSYFKQIFELSPDPTWIIEGNRFVECNDVAIRTLGYPNRDVLLNVHPSKLSPPRQNDGEDSYVKAERMMAIAKDKGLHRFEWIHTKANGTDFVAEVTLSAIQLPGRQVIYCVWRDITERKRAESALQESRDQFRVVVEHSPVAMALVCADGTIEYINRKAIETFGYAPQDIPNMDRWWMQAYPDETYRAEVIALWMGLVGEAIAHNREIEQREYRVTCKNGSVKMVVIFGVWVADKVLVIFEDITERKQTEEALLDVTQQWQTTFNAAQDAICLLDRDQKIVRSNPAMAALTGVSAEHMRGKHCWEVVHGTTEPIPQCPLKRARMSLSREQMELQIGNRWLHITVDPVLGDAQEFQGAVHVIRDITERKQLEEQVQQLAFYDPLTQLPNRRLLGDRLSQALAESKRSNCYGALLFLDLDNFKALNDKHGHAVGDLLLVQAARRMKRCVREVDTVTRHGGDEFVVVMGDLNEDKAAATTQASSVAEKIRAALAEPYLLAPKHGASAGALLEHRCTASLGAVVFIDREGTQDDYLRLADTAMYEAKNAGSNLIRFFEVGG